MMAADELTADLERILARIRFWRIESWLYRGVNIVLYLFAKILVPVFSAIIAANIALSASGRPFLGAVAMLVLSVLVPVISALDTLIKPGQKKQVAFDRINDLAEIEDTLLLDFRVATTTEAKIAALRSAVQRTRQVLQKATELGW